MINMFAEQRAKERFQRCKKKYAGYLKRKEDDGEHYYPVHELLCVPAHH